MHEDVDDEEDIVLDRRSLIDPSNNFNASSDSGPILLGVNRFNIKVYDDPVKLSQMKAILLTATCIASVRLRSKSFQFEKGSFVSLGNDHGFNWTNVFFSC